MGIRKEVLENGLTVVTQPMSQFRSVSVGVWLKRGSRDETPEENGIYHFIEHMVFKGTETRSAGDIARLIDSIGGQMNAFTSRELTCFSFRVLDEHLPVAIELVSDILQRPAFRESDVGMERNVILEEIKMVDDTADELTFDLFHRQQWPEHALGRPVQGVSETVSKMGPEVLRQRFFSSYKPENIVVSAAGNLDHEDFTRRIQEGLGQLTGASDPRGPEAHERRTGLQMVARSDLEQVHICLGMPGFKRTDPSRYAGMVMNMILGGGMSSRLFQNIREERGLVYAISSSVSTFQDTGYLLVYAATSPGNVKDVLTLIMEECSGLANSMTDEEIRRSKDHLKGDLILSMEDCTGRMSHQAAQEIYYKQFLTLDEIAQRVEAVTPDDIRGMCARLLRPEETAATLLGPTENLSLSYDDFARAG